MDNRKLIQIGIDYIEENLKAEITAQELADMAGFSVYHYYHLFQSATAILSESFSENDPQQFSKWISLYKNIICGYDSVAHLSDEEKTAIPYIILANQFICVAWLSEQEKYKDIFETNLKMTNYIIENFNKLQI